MRSLSLSLALAGLFAALPIVARADTFAFTLSGVGSTVSGTLTGTANAGGGYAITAINAPGISGLLLPGNIFFTNDNLLFPGAVRSLDINGFAFTQVMGGSTYQVNVFSQLGFNPPTNVQFFADTYDSNFNFAESPVTFAVSAVTPEPSSLFLMGTGMLVAASQLRRRVAR